MSADRVRRRVPRSLVPVFIVAAWALLAVSCGGSGEVSRDEYASRLSSAMADVEQAYGDAGSAIDGGGGASAGASATTGDRVEQLKTTQIAIRDAGNRLDGITPPSDLTAEHADLVAGVRDMADAIDLLVEAEEVVATNPARAKQLTREFATDDAFEQVVGASTAIRDAGVDVDL